MTAELNGIFTPVILGDSYSALKLAFHLRLRYGVKSHIFSTRPSLFFRLLPFAEHHKINYSNNDILLLDLENTASLYDATLLYLFPMSEQYSSFTEDRREQLEDKFVIVTDPSKLDLDRRL